MSTYRGLFNSRIYERGIGYYQRGFVSSISKEDNNYYATVRGSSIYQVEIVLRHGAVQYMNCDCPYAQDGHRCKHMAAVIIKMEKQGQLGNIVTVNNHNKNRENADIWNTIIGRYLKHTFVNRREKNALDKEFAQALLREHSDLLKPAKTTEVLKSLSMAIKAMNKLDSSYAMQQSNATFKMIILDLKDSSMCSKGEKWAQAQLSNAHHQTFFNMLLILAFPLTEIGEVNLKKQIDLFIKNKQYQEASICLKRLIEVKEAIGEEREQIYQGLLKFQNFEVVMDYGVSYYMDTEQFDKAKELINTILQKSNISFEKENDLKGRLVDIYIRSKDKENYKNYIIALIEENRMYGQKDCLAILHDMYDDEVEWENDIWAFSEQLKQADFYVVIDLYQKSKLYGLLLEYLYINQDIYTLVQFASQLHDYDSERFYAVFYALIINMIDQADSRYDYINVTNSLKELLSFDDHEELLLDVLFYAKENYSRKTALMQQLMELE